MSARYLAIVIIGVVLLFLSVLFPPWILSTKGPGPATELPHGYAFLFTMPEPDSPTVTLRVDFKRLLLQWVILGGGLAAALWREKRRRNAAGTRPDRSARETAAEEDGQKT